MSTLHSQSSLMACTAVAVTTTGSNRRSHGQLIVCITSRGLSRCLALSFSGETGTHAEITYREIT